MRNIKTKNIDPKKMYSKSEYAKMIGVSPAAITKQIASGKLTIVVINGAELIHV